MRRGDPGAAAALDEALELAHRTRTLQRLGPVRAARAEAQAAWDLAVRHEHSWHTAQWERLGCPYERARPS